jgi:hypothetical protein
MSASGSVLPVAGSARFRGRMRVQGNRPCARKLRASGVKVAREQRAGDAIGHGDPAGGYAEVTAVFQWHTCVSRGNSTYEQEGLEVRGGVGIANQSDSIISSQWSTTSNSSYPSWIAQPLSPRVTRRLLVRPSSTHGNPFWQTSSSPTESRHRRALLIADLVRHRSSLSTRYPLRPRLPQGLP